jgi:hypothetical protein
MVSVRDLNSVNDRSCRQAVGANVGKRRLPVTTKASSRLGARRKFAIRELGVAHRNNLRLRSGKGDNRHVGKASQYAPCSISSIRRPQRWDRGMRLRPCPTNVIILSDTDKGSALAPVKNSWKKAGRPGEPFARNKSVR